MDFMLPGVLRDQARSRPNEVAIRQKEFGRWHEVTWWEFDQRVRAVSFALKDLGVGEGGRCVIVSDNEPEWVYADLGIQAIGAASIGVYPIQMSAEVEYIISHSRSVVAFCGDQEQVDKVLASWDRLPHLEWVVCSDMKGVAEYDHPKIIPFGEFLDRGQKLAEASPAGSWDTLLGKRRADEVAVVGYTSGTTGRPKGATLTHANVTLTAKASAPIIRLSPGARVLAQFPLAHPTARNMDVYAAIVAGASVNFPESVETVGTDMYEIAPTFMTGTPRVYESIAAGIQIRMQKASWGKRKVFELGMRQLDGVLERELNSTPRALDRLRRAVGRATVARWVTDALGMRQVRFAACGGAATSPELLKFFWALGVKVYEVYGQTETAGLVFCQRDLEDLGTSGYPVGQVESRIDEHGELLVRGDGIFTGYLDDRAKTMVALNDGWYSTGDIAKIDDKGRLIMLDRDKAIIHAADGDVSPSEIENKLKFSPFIREAMVVAGDDRICALIQIEFDTCADWGQRHNLPYTTFRSLASLPEVQELIRSEVEKANVRLAADRRIADFRLLPKELDPDDNEITPSFKVKREVVGEKFCDLIQEMVPSFEPPAVAAQSSAS